MIPIGVLLIWSVSLEFSARSTNMAWLFTVEAGSAIDILLSTQVVIPVFILLRVMGFVVEVASSSLIAPFTVSTSGVASSQPRWVLLVC